MLLFYPCYCRAWLILFYFFLWAQLCPGEKLLVTVIAVMDIFFRRNSRSLTWLRLLWFLVSCQRYIWCIYVQSVFITIYLRYVAVQRRFTFHGNQELCTLSLELLWVSYEWSCRWSFFSCAFVHWGFFFVVVFVSSFLLNCFAFYPLRG